MIDNVVIGIDVGGTNIVIALIKDSDYLNASYKTIPYIVKPNAEELSRYIYDAVSQLADDNGFSHESIKKIGLAFPGSIDSKSGIVNYAHNLKVYDADIVGAFAALCPSANIKLINDADAATIAEQKLGVLKNCKNACLITLGTGIGGGLILGGKLFLGGLGRGVELGHVILDSNSKIQCTCKNYGCVEVLCNAGFLESMGEKHFDKSVSAKQVIDLAKQGNETAVTIFNEYIENLSSALASIINLLDLEKIALAGGISLSGEFLLAPLRKATAKKCFFDLKCEILLSTLQEYAGALGAGIYSE
ncbi:MAG: ROK family protein [Clostridiales bacterium]|nr:ROK family protein [Clostridiales bacterium]